jgi:glycosyltransferase involved in cell wall biosynthesis/protein-tyrosine-phosphatase
MIPLTDTWPVGSASVAAASSEIRVCHVMSADLWAGAEVQVGTVASYLMQRPEVKLTVVLLNDGRLARELRTLGVEVAVVDEGQHTAAHILAFLTRFLRAHRVDILHTHRYKDTVLGTLAAKLAGVPHVIRTVHGLAEPMRGWDRAKFRAYDALDKAALWCFADRIIAVSAGMAETLRATGYKRSAVVPIHNGIDLTKVRVTRSRYDLRRELGISTEALVIGTVGRLSPVKAQGDLLRAAQRILRKEPDARFVIVGDGPLRRELAEAATQLGVERACSFVGSRHDIQDLVAAMDIFVLSSLHEGIPMALLEAMALGTPVVATAVGGVPEVVTDRVSGLLVPPRDDRALADACVALARDRPWAQKLGVAARRIVTERFSHEVNGEALVREYRSVSPLSERVTPGASKGARERTSGADLSAPALGWELARCLFRLARRRATRAIGTGMERRRMNRVRQNPSSLTAALRSARRILMVCHGNIIRSAFAARLVAEALGDRETVRISSGGLAAVAGKPAHPTAIQLATARSVDLSRHAASPVAQETVAESDVIFVMDIPQLVTMRQRFPEARSKTFLLTCLAADAPLEIRDPVDGDESRFEACFDHISSAASPIVGAIRGTTIPR